MIKHLQGLQVQELVYVPEGRREPHLEANTQPMVHLLVTREDSQIYFIMQIFYSGI